MDTDLIIYAVIAVGLVLWLRSILGTRNGDERSRPNPFAAPPADGTSAAQPGIAAAPKLLPGQIPQPVRPLALERHMSIVGAHVNDALSTIARADRGFDLPKFMHGAQDAFVMIVEAFARGDRTALKGLVGDDVFTAFDRAIAEREKSEQTASVEIHAVRHVDAIAAKLDGKQATITVRFVSDQTNVLRDKDSKVTQGNPDRVSEVIDLWTFSRDLRSKDPTWLLTATREEEAPSSPLLPKQA